MEPVERAEVLVDHRLVPGRQVAGEFLHQRVAAVRRQGAPLLGGLAELAVVHLAGAGATQPAKATVVQGALEASNVQPVLEISKMIEVMRAYEATATLSKSHEDMTRDAITKLGAMPN